MAPQPSTIDPQRPEYQASIRHHRALADELRRRRHESRGKLFLRERIDRLLDSGSPFLEIAPLAAWDS